MATEMNEQSKMRTVHPPRRKRGEYEVCLCPVCGKEPKVYPYTPESPCSSTIECCDENGNRHLRVAASNTGYAAEIWNSLVEKRCNYRGDDLSGKIAYTHLRHIVKSGEATDAEKSTYSEFIRAVKDKDDEIALLKKRIEVATMERKQLFVGLARKLYGDNFERYTTERHVVKEEVKR